MVGFAFLLFEAAVAWSVVVTGSWVVETSVEDLVVVFLCEEAARFACFPDTAALVVVGTEAVVGVVAAVVEVVATVLVEPW